MKIFIVFAFLFASLRAYDPQLKGPGLSVGLISENRSVSPGQPFTVGLHLHHFAGFHSYWKNPGIVGVASSLRWTLPEGFTASEIAWPYPEKTLMATHPCHGYQRDVTLLVTITPPPHIDQDSVTFKAEAVWMCCAKGCFPGSKTFQMTLPVTKQTLPDLTAKAHIKKAHSEMPILRHTLSATLLSPPDASDIRVSLKGLKNPTHADLYFFSSDGQISSNQQQQFSLQSDGSLLLRVPRAEYSPKNTASLPGVLKVDERYYRINAFSKN